MELYQGRSLTQELTTTLVDQTRKHGNQTKWEKNQSRNKELSHHWEGFTYPLEKIGLLSIISTYYFEYSHSKQGIELTIYKLILLHPTYLKAYLPYFHSITGASHNWATATEPYYLYFQTETRVYQIDFPCFSTSATTSEAYYPWLWFFLVAIPSFLFLVDFWILGSSLLRGLSSVWFPLIRCPF